jgi:hypothetical protein
MANWPELIWHRLPLTLGCQFKVTLEDLGLETPERSNSSLELQSLMRYVPSRVKIETRVANARVVWRGNSDFVTRRMNFDPRTGKLTERLFGIEIVQRLLQKALVIAEFVISEFLLVIPVPHPFQERAFRLVRRHDSHERIDLGLPFTSNRSENPPTQLVLSSARGDERLVESRVPRVALPAIDQKLGLTPEEPRCDKSIAISSDSRINLCRVIAVCELFDSRSNRFRRPRQTAKDFDKRALESVRRRSGRDCLFAAPLSDIAPNLNCEPRENADADPHTHKLESARIWFLHGTTFRAPGT